MLPAKVAAWIVVVECKKKHNFHTMSEENKKIIKNTDCMYAIITKPHYVQSINDLLLTINNLFKSY